MYHSTVSHLESFPCFLLLFLGQLLATACLLKGSEQYLRCAALIPYLYPAYRSEIQKLFSLQLSAFSGLVHATKGESTVFIYAVFIYTAVFM